MGVMWWSLHDTLHTDFLSKELLFYCDRSVCQNCNIATTESLPRYSNENFEYLTSYRNYFRIVNYEKFINVLHETTHRKFHVRFTLFIGSSFLMKNHGCKSSLILKWNSFKHWKSPAELTPYKVFRCLVLVSLKGVIICSTGVLFFQMETGHCSITKQKSLSSLLLYFSCM